LDIDEGFLRLEGEIPLKRGCLKKPIDACSGDLQSKQTGLNFD
jgi:hypothetical protein